VTNEQWDRIRQNFPEESIPENPPGRKPVQARKVLDAVLWIFNAGARGHMLPQCYPNYKMVHRQKSAVRKLGRRDADRSEARESGRR